MCMDQSWSVVKALSTIAKHSLSWIYVNISIRRGLCRTILSKYFCLRFLPTILLNSVNTWNIQKATVLMRQPNKTDRKAGGLMSCIYTSWVNRSQVIWNVQHFLICSIHKQKQLSYILIFALHNKCGIKWIKRWQVGIQILLGRQISKTLSSYHSLSLSNIPELP